MQAAAALRGEEFVARPGDHCERCAFQAICPDQGRRDGAVVTPRDIDTPEQLRDLLGEDFTFSAQQFAAITAPLEPAVVIAGAGSGKTTVMAARVVWLVATGQVAPERGARPDLHHQGGRRAGHADPRQRCAQAGLLPDPRRAARPRDADEDEVEEPTVATYHAYAAALLTEHGLRIGHEPDTRLIADAPATSSRPGRSPRYTAPGRAASATTPSHVDRSTCSPSTAR